MNFPKPPVQEGPVLLPYLASKAQPALLFLLMPLLPLVSAQTTALDCNQALQKYRLDQATIETVPLCLSPRRRCFGHLSRACSTSPNQRWSRQLFHRVSGTGCVRRFTTHAFAV